MHARVYACISIRSYPINPLSRHTSRRKISPGSGVQTSDECIVSRRGGAYPEDRLGTTGATSERAPSRLRARTGAVTAETGTSRLRVRTVPRGGVSEGRWWRRGCGVLGSDGHARSSPLRVFEQFGRRKIFTTADATILHDFGTRWNSSRNDFDRYSKRIRMHVRGKKRLKKLIRF